MDKSLESGPGIGSRKGCLKASNSSSERKALVEVGPFQAIQPRRRRRFRRGSYCRPRSPDTGSVILSAAKDLDNQKGAAMLLLICSWLLASSSQLSYYSSIAVTTPEPTVLPPSLIANLSPASIAIGVISSMSILMLSPGMHISTPSGSFTVPVTSVVRK